MSVTEIEIELEKMTNAERLFIIEIATKLIRREILTEQEKLRRSAEIMLSEYRNDATVTALTALDGEAFLDA